MYYYFIHCLLLSKLDNMNVLEIIENYKEISLIEQLKHLKFEKQENIHIVSLIDSNNNEIIKGYGNTAIEALNDLHSTLL